MKNLTLKSLGFGLLFLLGLIIAFAPVDQMKQKAIPIEQLLQQLNERSVYFQPEEAAHMIIDNDPTFQLIDVRSAEDFGKYQIPGSVNLPLEKLTEAAQVVQEDKSILLTSNGNTKAGQAWILLKQMGYSDVYILDGGVNRWVQLFVNPSAPTGEYTDDELFTYQLRKAASPVMMGESAIEQKNATAEQPKRQVNPRVRKEVKKKTKEGC